jgi:hypothetical protein
VAEHVRKDPTGGVTLVGQRLYPRGQLIDPAGRLVFGPLAVIHVILGRGSADLGLVECGGGAGEGDTDFLRGGIGGLRG